MSRRLHARYGPDGALELEVAGFVEWATWLLGWRLESHPTERQLQVHVGPLQLYVWWHRPRATVPELDPIPWEEA